jgi:hypothetical protein
MRIFAVAIWWARIALPLVGATIYILLDGIHVILKFPFGEPPMAVRRTVGGRLCAGRG